MESKISPSSQTAVVTEPNQTGEVLVSFGNSQPELAAFIDYVTGLLHIGGPVVWILLGLSVFSLAVMLLKAWQYSRLRPESVQASKRALQFWQSGSHDLAVQQLGSKKPVEGVLYMAMHGLLEGRDRAVLEMDLQRRADDVLYQLRAYLKPLEVVASLAPLLGLMGTVLGMIVAFQQMEQAGSQVDPSVLSGGIWQALLTTAVGLAVAIPVAAVHSMLERKVERVAHFMEQGVATVFSQESNQLAAFDNAEIN